MLYSAPPSPGLASQLASNSVANMMCLTITSTYFITLHISLFEACYCHLIARPFTMTTVKVLPVVAWSPVNAGHSTPGAALCYYCARLVFYCEYVELVPTQARSRGISVRSVRSVPRMLCKLTSQVAHMCHFTARAILAVSVSVLL